MTNPEMMACHECDMLHRLPPASEGSRVLCSRCGALLCSHKKDSLDRTLALVLSGLILFFAANGFPLLGMKSGGLIMETTLMQGVTTLYKQGMTWLSFLVLLTCIIAPFIQLAGLLYVLSPLKFNRVAPMTPRVFRFIRGLQPWSMMEVFMLGILVSIVKLAKMATIIPGVSLFAFTALIFVMAWAVASLDPHIVWERVEIGEKYRKEYE